MKYFFINNTKINYIPDNRSIIEYCENLGIDIPHYCYHPNLSIAGNCRMCLVEVKNSPKPVISCAMSLLNKMEIYTNSPLVKKSREGVLEFLLLNHPLDCPVCDQGGECDLQDQSFVFGINKKRFYNFKRVVTDKNIGPLVKTVMTRCIHCTRCVRFSKEIAGVESLGIFGRGMDSEIGTYVTKVFNSELSGNIIDICPVGALTSKQYPFIGRVWELKNIKSIDFSDSSSTTIQVYVKSNSIVKIVPGYDNSTYSNSWISDKTRFSFDGMFSPERIVDSFIVGGLESKKRKRSWLNIFEDIIYIIYFQDHLSRHLYQKFKMVITFNDNLDLESLNLLIVLTKKYNFIHIRKLDSSDRNIDLETTFLLNTLSNTNNINKSDLCVLVSINPRYENIDINIKLRQRFLRGNFKLFSIGSFTDLTYPTQSIGSSTKVISNLAEGNNILCQDFAHSVNPIILLSSNISNRNDSSSIFSTIFSLKENTNIIRGNWHGLNILNTSINESGVSYTSKFKNLTKNDFSTSSMLYMIENDFKSTSLNQIINLKLLNYFHLENNSKSVIELHNVFTGNFLKVTKKNLNTAAYINLPTKVFFETSNLFLNNSGVYKKTVKILSSLNKSKENWQVIRKTISSLSNITFLSNNLSAVTYNILNFKNFIKFLGFQYFPVSSISSYCLFYKEITNYSSINFKFKSKLKVICSKTNFWLDDFYLGGKDIYSRFSSVMIECSKSFRIENTNFNYIN